MRDPGYPNFGFSGSAPTFPEPSYSSTGRNILPTSQNASWSTLPSNLPSFSTPGIPWQGSQGSLPNPPWQGSGPFTATNLPNPNARYRY